MPVLGSQTINNKQAYKSPSPQEQSILHAATLVLLVLVFVCSLTLILAIGFSKPDLKSKIHTTEFNFPVQGMPGY